MRTVLMIAAATAACASLAGASVLVGSFENTLSEPLGNWTTVPAGNSFSGTGATDGSSSLSFVAASGFNWALTFNGNEPLRDAILDNDMLLFDVTVPGEYIPGISEYMVFYASFNSESTGWQQTSANLQRTDGGGDNALGGDRITMMWNYSLHGTQPIVNPASSWSQFNIATNWGGAQRPTMYVDNVRLARIPEPATLGALVAAGALVLRRRG